MVQSRWSKNILNNLGLLLAFSAYALVSEFLLFITSNGWASLSYFLFGSTFYIGFFIILFVSSFFCVFSFDVKKWRPIFIVQAIILLFNFGDCGDANGGMNFIQRLFKGHILGGSCSDMGIRSPIVDPAFVLILIAVYIFLLFFIIFNNGIKTFVMALHPKSLMKKIIRFWKYGR